MPLYEYRCESCSKVFETYVRSSEEKAREACPSCGGHARKLGISLISDKGSGSGGPVGGSSCGAAPRRSPFG